MEKFSHRERKRDGLIASSLIIFSFFVFWLSPIGQGADSHYSVLLSQSLLEHQSFTLDHYAIPRFRGIEHFGYYHNGRIYQIQIFDDHLYYYFPPGSSVLSVPYVAVMNAVGISAANEDGTYNEAGEMAILRSLAAMLMAALTGLFYLTARLVLQRKWSLIVALGGAFGTQVWSTATRSLWNHTWMILLLGVVVLMLVAADAGRRRIYPFALATLLAWMYFVRPTSSVCIVAISLYVFLYHREAFLRFALTSAAWLALFVAYSWYHFGQLLPHYYLASRLRFDNVWMALAGNLISPSRGTLVFVPILFFVIYLLVRFRRELIRRRLITLAVAVIVMHFIAIAGFSPWTGGHCYGARYTTDLVPWFVLLAVSGVEAMLTAREREQRQVEYIARNWNGLLAAGAGLLLLSVFINARGALSPETARWNSKPVNVDIFPERVWDWRRPQFLAGLQRSAPPSYPWIESRIDFSQPATDVYLWYGWSGREERFRWIEGNEAAIVFALGEAENVTLRMMLSPFLVPEQLTEQRVILRLNGHALAAFTLRESAEPHELSFALPREMLRRENVLIFDLPDADSPAAFGISDDTRSLGVAAYWLEIESPALREASRNQLRRTATNLPLPGEAFRAEISIIDSPLALDAGGRATIRVRVRNASNTLWPALGRSDNRFQLWLGNHWLDADEITVVEDDGRSPLPYDLRPGTEVEIPITITAPVTPGEYFLEVDMIQEGVSWFDNEGSPAARVSVNVR